MGLVNEEMSKRLFLAMDDDKTGAMEAHEFLAGIRKMCDESGGKTWLEQRINFAFMLFDLDREGTVDQSEVKSFLKCVTHWLWAVARRHEHPAASVLQRQRTHPHVKLAELSTPSARA